MKIAGKKFWAWMSLWVFSFFLKGELGASPRPDSPEKNGMTTTNQPHDGSWRADQETPKKDDSKRPSLFTPRKEGGKVNPFTPKKDGGRSKVTPFTPKKDGGSAVKTDAHKGRRPSWGKGQWGKTKSK